MAFRINFNGIWYHIPIFNFEKKTTNFDRNTIACSLQTFECFSISIICLCVCFFSFNCDAFLIDCGPFFFVSAIDIRQKEIVKTKEKIDLAFELEKQAEVFVEQQSCPLCIIDSTNQSIFLSFSIQTFKVSIRIKTEHIVLTAQNDMNSERIELLLIIQNRSILQL